MALVTWFCREAAGLTLGTYDDIKDPRLIKFKAGYVDLDDQADYYPLQLQWIAGAANAFGIRCLGPSDSERRPFSAADLSCPVSVPTTAEASDAIQGHFVRNQVACTFRAPTEQEISQHMLAVHAPKVER